MDVYRLIWSLATTDGGFGRTTFSYLLDISRQLYNNDTWYMP
jgi:hypothetical protein